MANPWRLSNQAKEFHTARGVQENKAAWADSVELRLAKLEEARDLPIPDPEATTFRRKPTVGEIVRDLGGELRVVPDHLRDRHYAEALESAAKMFDKMIYEAIRDGRIKHSDYWTEAAALVRAHRVEVKP